MAQRVIYECDLCKGEFDPSQDDTFVISVKKKGKTGKSPSYEICGQCANKISIQLAAVAGAQLDTNWVFGLQKIAPGLQYPPGVRSVTIGEANEVSEEQKADDELIRRKTEERRVALTEAGQEFQEEEEAVRDLPYETVKPRDADGNCTHINKGRIHFDKSHQRPMQQCRDCGEWMAPGATSVLRNERPQAPQGVTLSSHASDRRNR